VPGNGFNSATIENYRDFIARDIARILLKGYVLKIDTYLLLLGSVGGELLGKFWLGAQIGKILFHATDWSD
jgi:hypothetical protein